MDGSILHRPLHPPPLKRHVTASADLYSRLHSRRSNGAIIEKKVPFNKKVTCCLWGNCVLILTNEITGYTFCPIHLIVIRRWPDFWVLQGGCLFVCLGGLFLTSLCSNKFLSSFCSACVLSMNPFVPLVDRQMDGRMTVVRLPNVCMSLFLQQHAGAHAS